MLADLWKNRPTQASENFEAASGAMRTARSASRTLSGDQFREPGLQTEDNKKGTNLSVPIMSSRRAGLDALCLPRNRTAEQSKVKNKEKERFEVSKQVLLLILPPLLPPSPPFLTSPFLAKYFINVHPPTYTIPFENQKFFTPGPPCALNGTSRVLTDKGA